MSVLVVEDLVMRYGGLTAVDGVSLTIAEGETYALVGESGCGKSTLARCAVRLATPTGGRISVAGTDITRASRRALRPLRGGFQLVFQDPMASLDPRLTVHDAVAEGPRIHGRYSRSAVDDLLAEVGLDPSLGERLPHQLSGGQRQRVGIARALALRPRLLVLDEPVASLDVSVQAQVVNLLRDLQDRHGLAYLFIAHDLAVVASLAHRVGVMYLGRLVEEGPAEQVLTDPRHPYTRALVDAIPVETPAGRRDRPVLAGEPPSPVDRPPGCAFHPRCPIARPSCAVTSPVLAGEDRRVACPHV
ncbi:ABC transporter ATP-binding protein [Dactylosporangium sp. AC04546]|uniref:ABC transporter ATP-binding protein n=1 Tax=Dactylosporangium sp. AC04546 TaxID=2862460 RepID=UPI001EE0D271|nr:ABC transporter ATP-binding protein [Dactylosporangium sp. AC04546]WVK78440.1 ABC transporter ATP-binding protein [Dactylosporangium sp. AC04546]